MRMRGERLQPATHRSRRANRRGLTAGIPRARRTRVVCRAARRARLQETTRGPARAAVHGGRSIGAVAGAAPGIVAARADIAAATSGSLFTSVAASTHWHWLRCCKALAGCVARRQRRAAEAGAASRSACRWCTTARTSGRRQRHAVSAVADLVGFARDVAAAAVLAVHREVEAARAGAAGLVGVALIHRAGAHALTIRTAVGGAALHAALAAVVFVGL